MCQASVSGRTLPRFQKPSTFILELNNGREAAIFPPEAVLEKTGLSHQIVILLAEDEPLVRNVIRTILASSGYLVLDAADGIQAVELARDFEGRIDLLLTDLKMPNMNGAQAAQIIAAERPGIGVLVISGHASDEIRSEASSLAFLRKPFLPAVLLGRIRELLSK
jgi:two-component system, cell cycle sensor histidine kinase and response regulator CckA